MAQRNYETVVPTQPSEKAKVWAQKKSGCDKKHLLLYKNDFFHEPLTGRKCKAAKLSCSACGKTMWAEKIDAQCCSNSCAPAPFGWMHPVTNEPKISGNNTFCPGCQAEVKVEFLRDGRRENWGAGEYWFMTVERVEELLTLVGWVMKKEILRDRESGQLSEQVRYLPYQAYVFEEKKAVQLRGYDKYFSQITFREHWRQRDRCMDEYGDAGIFSIAPWDKRLLIGSSCENSKLDLYLKIAREDALPVTYLRLWQKRKTVENLVVQGAGSLLNELIRLEVRRTYSGAYCNTIPALEGINWKEKRPAQMLGLSKEEFRHCVNDRWDRTTWGFFRECKELGVHLRLPEELALCREAGLHGILQMAKKGYSIVPVARYLAKQRGNTYTLTDYWRMAEGEGYDLNLRQVRWPKDLNAAHDRVIRERQDRVDRERDERKRAKNAELAAKFTSVAEKLAWMAMEADGICIRVCGLPEELDNEGKTLSHCVATYKEKHARGDSAIFFIRKAKAPDKPWYTLQLDLSKGADVRVIQNRGKSNCDRIPEVQAFEDKWLEFVKTNWIKHNKKKERRKTA